MFRTAFLVSSLALVGSVQPALAQSASRGSPVASVDLTAGWIGFIDESLINHGAFGGSVRFHLTPRFSVGPEFVYAMGPGDDRDLFLTGNLTFDFSAPGAHRVTPFLVAGGGWFRHSDRFGTQTFSASEGAFTGGGGLRARVTDVVSAGGELRVGWEPHMRVTGFVTVAVK